MFKVGDLVKFKDNYKPAPSYVTCDLVGVITWIREGQEYLESYPLLHVMFDGMMVPAFEYELDAVKDA